MTKSARFQETLDDQTKDILQQKQSEIHTHNIAVIAEVLYWHLLVSVRDMRIEVD